MLNIKKILIHNELEERYRVAQKFFERQAVIRQYYMEVMPEIMELSARSKRSWVDVYPFDWKFNSNEKNLWYSIRSNQVVFYPEFPVFSYFIDFANPYLRIGIEADSIKYHDVENDKERDSRLSKIGWTVFRVNYHESSREIEDLASLRAKQIEEEIDIDEEVEDLMLNSSEGVVQAIEYFYFDEDDERRRTDELFPTFRSLAEETLHKHCYTNLKLPKID
ncbi:MAG: DUF559 domain-containing protein [Opitutales bacterium]|nr:DUF559 domain-containing protein [Opitutales bacterium]